VSADDTREALTPIFALLAQGLPAHEVLDRHHNVISEAGWECDVCGAEVNGQTDDTGRPTINGDSVRHTP
jgi:hypothetical protein